MVVDLGNGDEACYQGGIGKSLMFGREAGLDDTLVSLFLL